MTEWQCTQRYGCDSDFDAIRSDAARWLSCDKIENPSCKQTNHAQRSGFLHTHTLMPMLTQNTFISTLTMSLSISHHCDVDCIMLIVGYAHIIVPAMFGLAFHLRTQIAPHRLQTYFAHTHTCLSYKRINMLHGTCINFGSTSESG